QRHHPRPPVMPPAPRGHAKMFTAASRPMTSGGTRDRRCPSACLQRTVLERQFQYKNWAAGGYLTSRLGAQAGHGELLVTWVPELIGCSGVRRTQSCRPEA